MAILSIGFACFDQFFFLNEWPQENTKTFVMILLKAAAVRRPMRPGCWDYGARRFITLVICSRTFTVSALSMSLPRRGGYQPWFSDDMITPLASVLVNRLTGSRTIITRKMQTPPS